MGLKKEKKRNMKDKDGGQGGFVGTRGEEKMESNEGDLVRYVGRCNANTTRRVAL